MKKLIRKFFLAVRKVLSNKPFAYFCLVLAIVGLFPPMIVWEKGPHLEQLLWPSLVKLFMAFIFIVLQIIVFHLLKMVVYKRTSRYSGIEHPNNTKLDGWNLLLNCVMFSIGFAIFFIIVIILKAIHLNPAGKERRGIPTWWIWDIIAVIAIGVIAYKIPNPVVMKDFFGY